jgi:hypothetical protein
MMAIDSDSVGNSDRFRTLEELDQWLKDLPRDRADKGRVTFLMTRGEGGRRETLENMRLTPEAGVPGDSWGREAEREQDAQIAVMEQDVAGMIANGQPLALFGDCLILDLNLSAANLPIGSRLRAGGAVLQVTPKPHNGCRKFRARFGDAALRFVSMGRLRHNNLRGIYLRVIESGAVRVGDEVEVISRPEALAATIGTEFLASPEAAK